MSAIVAISQRVVLINSISGLCTRVLRATLLLWMYQYLLRRVSQDEFASYAIATALMVVAPLYSSVFTSGISRYVVAACARGDLRRATQIVSSVFPLLLGSGIAFVAAAWTFAWHIDSFLTVPAAHLRDVQLMFGLLAVDFAVQMAMTPFAAGIHVRQKYVVLNAIELGVELFRMSLVFLFLIGLDTRVIWIVIASVTANAVKVLLTTTVSLRLLPAQRVKLELFEWRTARQLCSFGVWTSLNQLAGILYIDADIIVLNKLAAAADVAVFKLGLDAYSQLNALVVSTLVSTLPALTSLHARGEHERIREGFLRGARYISWFAWLLVLPVIVYRNEIVTLYVGARYIEAAQVMALLLALFPFMSASFFLAPLSAARAELRSVCLANLGVQLVRLAVCIYAVKWLALGAFGAALSTFSVMAVAHAFILGPMAMHSAQVSWRRYASEVVIRAVIPALAGTLTWVLLRAWVMPASWVTLGLCGAAGALVYVATLVTWCLTAQERTDLLSIVRRTGERAGLWRTRVANPVTELGGIRG